MPDPSALRVLLVGVTAGDLDRVRHLLASDARLRIAGAILLDPDARIGALELPHDLVVLTPEAIARMQGGPVVVGRPVVRRVDGIAVEELTEREREVLARAAEGLGNRAIGELLGISEHTVKFHLASVYGKLGVGNRTEAVQAGLRRGLLEI